MKPRHNFSFRLEEHHAGDVVRGPAPRGGLKDRFAKVTASLEERHAGGVTQGAVTLFP